MKIKDKNLTEIVEWSQMNDLIKTVILEGSMGSGDIKDEYSDYDINLFVKDTKPFVENDDWFERFDEVVVFQKEGTYYRDTFIPTRLVIYQNSRRVDFSFWPLAILENWIANEELPEFYKNGYQILLDKTGLAEKLIKPTYDGYRVDKPAKDIFLQTIYNFYFEAAIIAKYLYRKNLWFACKLSSGPIKDFLQQMIMWQSSEIAGWNLQGMNSLGKNLEEKISTELTGKLNNTFSRYDLDDCWKSLYAMMETFDDVSKYLCDKMKIEYPEEKVGNIIVYINNIHSLSLHSSGCERRLL